MAFHKGFGGKVTKVASPNVDICVGKWVGKRSSERIEVITSCGRTCLGSIPKLEGTITMPFDDANTIATLGLEPESTVTLRFYLGDSTHYFAATVYIESEQYTVDNASGAVMIDLAFFANLSVGSPAWAYT